MSDPLASAIERARAASLRWTAPIDGATAPVTPASPPAVGTPSPRPAVAARPVPGNRRARRRAAGRGRRRHDERIRARLARSAEQAAEQATWLQALPPAIPSELRGVGLAIVRDGTGRRAAEAVSRLPARVAQLMIWHRRAVPLEVWIRDAAVLVVTWGLGRRVRRTDPRTGRRRYRGRTRQVDGYARGVWRWLCPRADGRRWSSHHTLTRSISRLRELGAFKRWQPPAHASPWVGPSGYAVSQTRFEGACAGQRLARLADRGHREGLRLHRELCPWLYEGAELAAAPEDEPTEPAAEPTGAAVEPPTTEPAAEPPGRPPDTGG